MFWSAYASNAAARSRVKGKAEGSELTFWRASSSYGSRWWAREEELVHVQQRGGRARGLYNETNGNEAELSLVWPVLFGRRLVDKWCSYKKTWGWAERYHRVSTPCCTCLGWLLGPPRHVRLATVALSRLLFFNETFDFSSMERSLSIVCACGRGKIQSRSNSGASSSTNNGTLL